MQCAGNGFADSITDTLITAKAKVSYSDRELGAEGEGTSPWEHICFIISRSIILL